MTQTVAASTPLIRSYRTRDWPTWRVPVAALAEWAALSDALAELGDTPACADKPELWWSKRPEQIAAAQVVCAFCPVVEVCRAYVLAAGGDERDGVWGGLAPGDRL